MPRFIKILSSQNIKSFDNPPELSGEHRKQMFTVQNWVMDILETLPNPTNKVGFVLQLGYFRAVNKFYSSSRFRQNDIEYVSRNLNLKMESVNISAYKYTTSERHQQIILEEMEFRKFTSAMRDRLAKEAALLTSRQQKPRLIFMSLVDFLQTEKIQVPSYNTLAEIITDSLKNYERDMVRTVNGSLTEDEKALIDNLLEKEDSGTELNRYTLTSLKNHSHSIRAGKIKDNIKDYEHLENLFNIISPILKNTGITSEAVKYYADAVFRSQVFQISRRDDNRFLYLISFIVNSFYELNDMLVLKVNKIVQQSINSGEKEEKEQLFENRMTKTELIKNVADGLVFKKQSLAAIKKIMYDPASSPAEKIEAAISILEQDSMKDKEISEHLVLINTEIRRISCNADYYDSLEAKSRKLQNKVSDIIRHFTFDEKTSDSDLLESVDYFQKKSGKIDSNAPLHLFDNAELKVLFSADHKIRVSLYKILLFIKVSNGIKSGALNLVHSYDYRAFEDYLIPPQIWGKKKSEYLERSGLTGFENWSAVEENLRHLLKKQYEITNRNIENKENDYIRIDRNGKLILKRYEAEKVPEDILELFPQNEYISIYEVLLTVHRMTGFLDSFESAYKYGRDITDHRTTIAGILGYGCNIGIHEIAKLSKGINVNRLTNTVKTRFTLENIQNANSKVVSLMGEFELSRLFKKHRNRTHTASDGQKFLSRVDSVYANKSFKYFGMNDGLVINSFIDDSYRLFYSTVISPAEREAAYTIDGLLHNEVVQSDIHSTDTHGYNEIIFAVTHLLGISFAPRIADFKKQYLYSFDYVANVKKLGYQIVPDRKINTKLIRDNWDGILRMIATLRTREVTASQLFRRLSSYSREHSLYRALKEFGKIIKTLFLLKYIDDVDLRKQIQKMLNKIEGSNKLANAVFHGKDREFRYAGKDEQLVADACKRLIENAIICWNYAYLTKLVSDAKTDEQKEILIKTIKNRSVVAWEHINLGGIYDFSNEIITSEYDFKKEQLLKVVI
ncbi:MAG: Tn3 family transposase [bacterium]|jgi:TnpA family transposase|nr:Tn3 family transposase [bacterium]